MELHHSRRTWFGLLSVAFVLAVICAACSGSTDDDGAETTIPSEALDHPGVIGSLQTDAEDCTDGQAEACDDLVVAAARIEHADDYANLGATCGGRVQPGVLSCELIFGFRHDADEAGEPPTGRSDLDDEAQWCHDNLQGCDALGDALANPEPIQTYRHYGATCGDRTGLSDLSCVLQYEDEIPPSSHPFTPLGNSELDTLAQQCHAGVLENCDDLVRAIDIDMAHLQDVYVEYAQTCGGRIEQVNVPCVSIFGSVASPSLPDLDVSDIGRVDELDALMAACMDGSLGSCDQLGLRAPKESGYWLVAASCGGNSPNDSPCVQTSTSLTDEVVTDTTLVGSQDDTPIVQPTTITAISTTTTTDPRAPGPPRSVGAEVSRGAIVVSWGTPAGSANVDSYTVEVVDAATQGLVSQAEVGTATIYPFREGASGTSYQFRVRAADNDRVGEFSELTPPYIFESGEVELPIISSITEAPGGGVIVSWIEPTTYDVASYEVTASRGDESVPESTTGSSVTMPTVDQGAWEFVVTANKPDGTTVDSKPAQRLVLDVQTDDGDDGITATELVALVVIIITMLVIAGLAFLTPAKRDKDGKMTVKILGKFELGTRGTTVSILAIPMLALAAIAYLILTN